MFPKSFMCFEGSWIFRTLSVDSWVQGLKILLARQDQLEKPRPSDLEELCHFLSSSGLSRFEQLRSTMPSFHAVSALEPNCTGQKPLNTMSWNKSLLLYIVSVRCFIPAVEKQVIQFLWFFLSWLWMFSYGVVIYMYNMIFNTLTMTGRDSM